MKTVCELNACTGCSACLNICAKNAIHIVDNMKNLNAVIDEGICVDCGRCTAVCPNNVPVTKNKPLFWKQGWAKDNSLRLRGSSGGVASALIRSFIDNGGYVCACLFSGGSFVFECTRDLEVAKLFAGSKYVKSDPGYIYREIKKLLEKNEKILFIGLPCQVAALYNFIPQNLRAALYTVELVCHGTPSVKLLELYLAQKGIRLADVSDIKFRNKETKGLQIDGKSAAVAGTADRYVLSFLYALNQTDKCYSCQYASIERVADVTLGDSWGSAMVSELPKGLSLITAQTEKGMALLGSAELELYDVDRKNALKHNLNLHQPTPMPAERERFFSRICKGANYDRLVLKYLPKQCWRQIAKGIALRLKLKSVTPKSK